MSINITVQVYEVTRLQVGKPVKVYCFCNAPYDYCGTHNSTWCLIAKEAGLSHLMTYPKGHANPTDNFFKLLEEGAVRLKRHYMRHGEISTTIIQKPNKARVINCGISLEQKLEVLRYLWRAGKRALEVNGIVSWG